MILEGVTGGLGGGYGSEFGSGVQGKLDAKTPKDLIEYILFSTYFIEWYLRIIFLFQGGVGAHGAKKCNTDQGELNNPKCWSTQKCVWSFHYQSGVCIYKSTEGNFMHEFLTNHN